MGHARLRLIESGLPDYSAYSLLGRSILIRYLEDRDILTSEWIQNNTKRKYDNYISILDNIQDTLNIFNILESTLSGDLFPLTNYERNNLSLEQLRIAANFLQRVFKNYTGTVCEIFLLHSFDLYGWILSGLG